MSEREAIEAIVAWLREQVVGLGTDPCGYLVAELADAIERGDHLSKPEQD